jgi:predicted phage gp36 major capsid-like protein
MDPGGATVAGDELDAFFDRLETLTDDDLLQLAAVRRDAARTELRSRVEASLSSGAIRRLEEGRTRLRRWASSVASHPAAGIYASTANEREVERRLGALAALDDACLAVAAGAAASASDSEALLATWLEVTAQDG